MVDRGAEMTADGWPVIVADVPSPPPRWAVLQRYLFDVLDRAWRIFADRYTGPDGRLIYSGPYDSRDGVDDFYEPFFNWPTLYLMGGSDDVLVAAKHHWEGVTRQLTGAGMLINEYERGYDWFHQGESLLFFYGLCLADPVDETFRKRASRFADLYLGGSPDNYDPATNLIRAPHNGAGGPRWGLFDSASFDPGTLQHYGLPLDWLDDIDSYEDIRSDTANRDRLAAEMQQRMGRGDVAVNLASTSLALNAYLLTGDNRYRDWLLRYVDGWMQRALDNGGILPDNVGLSGVVGEYLEGRWYGGHYGWSWPHGLHSIGAAAIIASINAALASGDDNYLDLGRGPVDLALAHAHHGSLPMTSTLAAHWHDRLGPDAVKEDLLLVPYRINDHGWFDEHPIQLAFPAALWCHSQSAGDLSRLERLRTDSGYDWRKVRAFRDKEEAGHEAPWLAYLAGDNPTYPEEALTMACQQVARRLALIDTDTSDPAGIDIHHWQDHNPVVTEALLQLTCGSPQVLYNGGLLQARIRYYDPARERPGLPPNVAALVSSLGSSEATVTLVNVDPGEAQRVFIQAGTYGEHRIIRVKTQQRTSAYPGSPEAYIADPVTVQPAEQRVDSPVLEVLLPPGTQVRLDMYMTLRAYPPSYRRPWDMPGDHTT